MAVKQYNPKKVFCTIGEIVVEGYAKGTFLEIEQNEDDFSLYTGADGQGVRALNASSAATVKITLSPRSKTNEQFSLLRTLDKESGLGVRPFLCKDLSSTDAYAAASIWIKRAPRKVFAAGIEANEWTLETDAMNSFFGSSGDPPRA
jgi:hypothetical protein